MKYLFSRTGTLGVCLFAFSQFTQAQSSAQELMGHVVKALEAKDSATLSSLASSQEDVKRFVRPSISPAVTNSMTTERFVEDYTVTSEVGLTKCLTALGGHRLELVKVDLGKPTKKTNNYTFYPPPQVTLRDNGIEKTLYLTGAILERDGTFKVATYFVSPSLQK